MIKGDFINNVFLKTPLQLWLYNIIAFKHNIRDNSIIVSGPDVIRHLFDARTTFARQSNNYINIVEIDKDVYANQKKILDELKTIETPVPLWMAENIIQFLPSEVLPIDSKVNLIKDDVANIEPERIIDADLMGTIRSIGNTLIKVFNNQSIKFPNNEDKLKAFIFTASLRGCGEIDTISWLRNQLLIRIGTEIDFRIDDNGHYIKNNLTNDAKSRRSITSMKNNNIKLYKTYDVYRPGRLVDMTMFSYIDSKGPMLTGLIIYK